jgi:hypothetical protein
MAVDLPAGTPAGRKYCQAAPSGAYEVWHGEAADIHLYRGRVRFS